MKRPLIPTLVLLLAVVSCHKNPVRPPEPHQMWIQHPHSPWTNQYVYFEYGNFADTVNKEGIYRLPVAGQGPPELVVPGGGFPAVSPCGDKLLCDINYTAWIMDLRTIPVDSMAVPLAGDPHNIITTGGWLGCDTVIYTNQLDDIWMFDLATGENKQLYSGLGHVQTPTGSRNGMISFLSLPPFGSQLHISLLTVHDGTLDTIIVLDSLFHINNPCISPGGGDILFLLSESYLHDADTWWTTMSVNTVDVATHAITRLVDSDLDESSSATWVDSPTWTTDGQVIYIGYDQYDSQLWIHDISGHNRVLLTREQLINGLKKGRVQ